MTNELNTATVKIGDKFYTLDSNTEFAVTKIGRKFFYLKQSPYLY